MVHKDTSSSEENNTLKQNVFHHLQEVWRIASELWKNRAFVACIVKIMRMEHHKFDTWQRPLSCLKWDRKAWSHQNFFVALGVGLDPGNWILFLMFQVLLHIRKKERISLPNDVTKDLAEQDVAHKVSPDLKLGEKKIEYMGDILEAIGGICHPWQKTSSTMKSQMISGDDLLTCIKFDETKDMMGQLAREMKDFTACVHRAYADQSEYQTLQLLLDIASRPDQEGDDADGSLNQQEKSRRNKEHAKRIIRSHPSETVSTSTGSNLTSRRQSDSSPILRHRGEEKSRLSRPDHEGDNAGRSLDQQKKTRRQTTQRRQGEEEPRPDHKLSLIHI